MILDGWFERLWPPWGLHILARHISAEDSSEARWTEIVDEVTGCLTAEATTHPADAARDLEAFAERVREAENRRLDGLEAKAATYLVGGSIAATIASAIAKLTFDSASLSSLPGWLADGLYAASIVYFLASTYYAVQTRRVGALAHLGVDAFLDTLRRRGGTATARTALLVAIPRWNEPALVRKSNYLFVTEGLFLRGVLALASAAILGLAATALSGRTPPAPSPTPTSSTIVPAESTPSTLVGPAATPGPGLSPTIRPPG